MNSIRVKQFTIIGVLAVISGCGERESTPDTPAEVRSHFAPAGSSWRETNHSFVITVPSATEQTDLAEATHMARATVEDARNQWLASPDEDRPRWAVKWAAPTPDGNVEHLWVQPVNWSPFRIEGVLISNPVSELEINRTQGELISFPIEELSDWIHYTTDDFAGPYDGGFTVAAIEKRYGKPEARK